ncbi:MAG TPA: 4-alpha-glucanotransferase [Methanospirillum sp.]|uniref:4-alpha-glucanotransferase n=1 Tax=Methanospirillum sp. TaxID=45200 RepID=UPI002B8FCD9A|nr:4-alpha-glucanotransferase [Methanospirillum sp.]HWQ64844.1 4-alpha-glucanotransferase [Methanospirillum sp.]
MRTRGSGVLLHITSLPSRFGIGDLGPGAYDFVQFLKDAGQRYWQILPIHPTEYEYDNSPYHALSAFAGNPLLISPDVLVSDGFIGLEDLDQVPDFPLEKVDFSLVIVYKEKIFTRAFERFRASDDQSGFETFCSKNAGWLDDYALFQVLRKKFSPAAWGDWPSDLKLRTPEALRHALAENYELVLKEKFLQYLFFLQWDVFRAVCKDAGILLIGDIPIYVDYDSADVWVYHQLFKLDSDLKPAVIAGVPPDYFSETGQIWDSPVYEWDELKKTGYSWWIDRIEHLASMVDYIRIDHFRGLIGFWQIPAGSETAITGSWVSAPGYDLLKTIAKRSAYLPIIAEDLGIITPDVREVMREFSLPGMKVLLFAFGNGMANSPYIPHNISSNCVVYTGTHDNPPVYGWFMSEATEEEKRNLAAYLGRDPEAEEVNWMLIRLAMMSVGSTVIIPMQDILNLGNESRMNCPGTKTGNWLWRFSKEQVPVTLSEKLHALTELYAR